MDTIALWLSLGLIFTVPWEAIVVFPGLGTLTRVIGFLVIATWLLTVLTRGGFRRLRPFHLAVFLFFFWNLVTIFWSVNLDSTWIRLQSYAQLLAMSLVIWDLYTTPRAMKMGLQAYILGSYVSIVSILNNYLSGNPLTTGRYVATGFNPNDLSLILALGIPVAWYLATDKSRDRKRKVLAIVNYAYIPIALFTIVLTGSRGGLIAAVPGIIFILWSFDRLGRFQKVLTFTVLIGSLFAIQSLVPQASIERLSTTAESLSTGSLSGRGTIWLDGLDVFRSHPIFGVGSSGFRYATELGRAPHNTLLSISAELGVIGLFMLAIILAITVYNAIRQSKWETRLWLAVLVTLALGAMVHSVEGKKVVWLFFTMIIVSANLPKQVESARSSRHPVMSTTALRG